jgi:hypothetical protein
VPLAVKVWEIRKLPMAPNDSPSSAELIVTVVVSVTVVLAVRVNVKIPYAALALMADPPAVVKPVIAVKAVL